MSGHSRWSQIKRKKGKADVQRGKLFSKILREITVAARNGGGDPKANMRLKGAIEMAKEANMPQDNIKRAIQKGTGEVPGESYEEVTYEGYAPGGVALLIHVLTDNRNRTGPEIRHVFEKQGGNLGSAGAVAWMFERKGVIHVDAEKISEDDLLAKALDPGLAATGYAVITPSPGRAVVVDSGVIGTASDLPLEARLSTIYDVVDRLLVSHAPSVLVLEDVYTACRFPRAALLMAHARGVVCLAARQHEVTVLTLSPAEVKRAVSANGAASKGQVQRSVGQLLGLARLPTPSHVADALALALTGLSRMGQRIQ